MKWATRARSQMKRVPRRERRLEFDRAVAEFFMRLALDEAKKGLGRTHPNPAVGAILVRGGRVIARGHHRKAGTAHAEVVALEAAGARAKGADLYTTLEPCDHFGRTPPCTQAIIDAGVRRVVFASSDPNPLVNGRGVRRLAKAGIPTLGGVLKDEADALNRPFFQFMRTGMPWVTLKAAVTLDGKLATATGDSRWVSSEASRVRVHQLRDQVDAILVGAGTVEHDDPLLTTRLPQGGRDAARVVVDSRLRASPKRKIFSLRSPAPTIVATLEREGSPRARKLSRRGATVWTVPRKGDRVDVKALLRRLAQEGHLHVLVEGGAELFSTLLRERLADELWLFLAPKLVGEAGVTWSGALPVAAMSQALWVQPWSVEQIDGDLLVRAGLQRD